jgi:hypothetical protein
MFALSKVWGFSVLLLGIDATAEEFYSFEMTSPNIRIEIPEIPNISMKPHPLRESQPELRFIGSKDGYNIVIITPAAEVEMTAKACAELTVKDVTEEFSFQEGQTFFDAAGNNTFQFRYALALDGGVFQLNSHILSVSADGHCVHVHISKFTGKMSDIEPWAIGFSGATVEEI